MYGATMGTLNVIINGATAFTASGNKGNQWLRKDVDLSLLGMYEVRRERFSVILHTLIRPDYDRIIVQPQRWQ